MATVRWTDKALSDVEDIYDYIASDSPFYAKHQAEKLFSTVKRLSDFPSSGRSIPEFPDLPHREILMSSYRIIYRYEPERELVFIVAVAHGSRLLKEID